MSGPSREALLASGDVSRETLDRIDRVLHTLDAWRGRTNLIGPKEWDRIWERHVWDSLQLRDRVPAEARIVDLGSGAGFPGLILAASARGDGHVTMIERVGKKCAFLRAAVEAADLAARVRQARVEDSGDIQADTVTARAFAPLPKLLGLAAPWLEAGAVGWFHKGASWTEELTAASKAWDFSCDAIPSRSGAAGVILRVSEVRRVG